MSSRPQCVLLAILLCAGSTFAGEPPRPNIVFILGDELGPDLRGCYGSQFYAKSTPRIDQLAKRGVRAHTVEVQLR